MTGLEISVHTLPLISANHAAINSTHQEFLLPPPSKQLLGHNSTTSSTPPPQNDTTRINTAASPLTMISASKAAREAKRAAKGKEPKKTAASRAKGKDSAAGSSASSVAGDDTRQDEIKRLEEQMDKHGLSDRITTGVLSSLKASRDVKITSASLVFHGRVLLQDTTLELSYGRRYGLLGENGCGKSTLLKAIAQREFPVPGMS